MKPTLFLLCALAASLPLIRWSADVWRRRRDSDRIIDSLIQRKGLRYVETMQSADASVMARLGSEQRRAIHRANRAANQRARWARRAAEKGDQ